MELYQHPTLYDDIYGAFTDDIAFYREVIERSTQPACELACGTGRLTVPLARELGEGRLLVATDAAPEMLAVAQERARSAGGPAAAVDFHVGDMRTPPNAPSGGWGTVIVALHSLSHLLTTADLRTSLAAIAGTLAPDGRLAFAVHNPDPVQLADDGSTVTRVMEEYSDVTLYGSSSYDSSAQIETVRWYLSRAEQTEVIEYSLRMIYPVELELLLELSGLQLEERFGWYDRSPFTGESGTQIVVARRA